MYFLNDALTITLNLESINTETSELNLENYKFIPLSEWDIKELLEKDNHFYIVEGTNYYFKVVKYHLEEEKDSELILIFEKLEDTIDENGRITLKLNYLGAYTKEDTKLEDYFN